MSQIYGVLNQLFLKFTNNSLESFPEIEGLAEEKQWILEIMSYDPLSTAIYHRLKPGLNLISEPIHLKQIDVFEIEGTGFLKHLYAKEIFSRLVDDERDGFWQSLQNLLKQIGLVQSCGSCIPAMTTLLQDFQTNNPGVDMKSPGIQGMMMKQLMTDPNAAKSVCSLFQNKDEETSILANIPDKLRALGLTTLNNSSAQIEEVNESDEEEETKEEETKNETQIVDETQTREETKEIKDEDASTLFKTTRKNRRKNMKQKQTKNIFASVAEMMDDKKLDSPDISELTDQLTGFFDGKNPEMAKMMENFTTNGSFTGVNPQELLASLQNGGMEDLMKKMGLNS